MPKDVTPRPARARRIPPPRIASNSSIRFTVTSAMTFPSSFLRERSPFGSLREQNRGAVNPTVAEVREGAIGIGKRILGDLGPHRNLRCDRHEFLAVAAG